jgi:hypothetical protein
MRLAVNVDLTNRTSRSLLDIARDLIRPPASTAQLLHIEASRVLGIPKLANLPASAMQRARQENTSTAGAWVAI